MADSYLFGLGNNPNPSLSKNIAFGDLTSEENMTFTQLFALASANILPVDTWHEAALETGWSASGIARSGLFYRKNKIGQLELQASVVHANTLFNQIITTLPVNYRPEFPFYRITRISTDSGAITHMRLQIDTSGEVSLGGALTIAGLPAYLLDTFIIPL